MSEGQSGRKHSEETKMKIGLAQNGKIISNETKLKMSQSKGKLVYVYSLDYQQIVPFTSARSAAKFLGTSDITIMKYARSNAIFKGEYILSLEVLTPNSSSED